MQRRHNHHHHHRHILFLLLSLLRLTHSRPINHHHLRLPSDDDNTLYCNSWRYSVETNNAGSWPTIPSRCLQVVQNYMEGLIYASDVEVAVGFALEFAKSLDIVADGKDAWVFDIDETLLSNLPFYQATGFGSEVFDDNAFDEWELQAKAPALTASLGLYNELQQLGFRMVLLTGRNEQFRNATAANLRFSGYDNWEKLILRAPSDKGKLAVDYKSEKRKELVDEGYRIRGNSGDQWSDLVGYAVAERSFKLPNPMYYIA